MPELIVFKEKEPTGRVVHAEVDGGWVWCPDCQESVHQWPATEKDCRRADNLRCESCEAYLIIEADSYKGKRTYKHPNLPEPGFVVRLSGGPLNNWMVRGIPEGLKNEFVRYWNKHQRLMVSKLEWIEKQSWRVTKTDEELVRIAVAAFRTSIRTGLLETDTGTDWEAELEEGVDFEN